MKTTDIRQGGLTPRVEGQPQGAPLVEVRAPVQAPTPRIAPEPELPPRAPGVALPAVIEEQKPGGASQVSALLGQQQPTQRPRRGRTPEFRLTAQEILASECRKTIVRTELRKVLEQIPVFAESIAKGAEGIAQAGDAVSQQLLASMKAAGLGKPEQAIGFMKKAGLDKLLAQALVKGRLTFAMADGEVERMRKELSSRTSTAVDLKEGCRAFDDAARRLSLVAGKNGAFEYHPPPVKNGARDLLMTFARSLHR